MGMNARRILFALVALACALLVLSTVMAFRLQAVVHQTDGLIKSYSSLDAWQVLAQEPIRDIARLNEHRQIILDNLPATLGELEHPVAQFTHSLDPASIDETAIQNAQALEDLLLWETFRCHQLQSQYSLLLNLMQFSLVAVILCIGLASYFMGRRAQDYRLAPFPEANPNPVFGLNSKGDIIYVNKAVEQNITRYLRQGEAPHSFLPPDYRQRLVDLKRSKDRQGEWIHSVSGRIFQYRIQRLPQIERIHIYTEDITEKETIRARNEFIAYHDPVCLIANRQRLEQVIDDMDEPDQLVTLVFCEVVGLLKVLSTQGLSVADCFARELTMRLRSAFQSVVGEDIKKPLIFRLDTSLFGCFYYHSLTDIQHGCLDKALDQMVVQPFLHGDREHFFKVFVGVACEPSSFSARQLIQRANLALHSIRQNDAIQYQIYDAQIESYYQSEHAIEQALRHAIEYRELVLHYQPQQDLGTGELIGFEALMRWNLNGTMQSPAQFIPIAEKTGLIHSIGRWALKQALMQSQQWQQNNQFGKATLAVNVSAQEFARLNYLEDVEALIEEYGGQVSHVQLEITESLLLDDEQIAIEKMHRLKALGFTLAIDDFGTGYSSFSYLSRFPVDKLKIDRSFIVNMENGPRDEAIISAMVEVAHQLGIQVIAEGVETIEQRQSLIALGCDQIQGYWYGKPMAIKEVERFIPEQIV